MSDHRQIAAYTAGGTPIPMPANLPPAKAARATKIVAGIFALLVMLLMGLLTMLIVGAETGPLNLLIGVVAGTLPVPFYLLIILWIDRFEAEPPWLLAFAFLWGATVAVLPSIFLNTLIQGIATAIFGEAGGDFIGATISAPLVEETAKGSLVFLLCFWQKDEFDGVVDGIVYGCLVALGFATVENFLYYGRAAGTGDTLGLLLLRGGLAPFSHPLFTSMTGIGLGLARQSDNKAVKFIAPPAGLLLAMFLHFVWNLSATTGTFPIVYFVFMVPLFLAFWGFIFFALRREGRVVRQYLQPEFERGWLTQSDYNGLCSVHGRLLSSLRALSGGFSVWRKRSQYNQVASELAFIRNRLARNSVRDRQTALHQENMYLQAFMSLRQQLGTY
jgi:RsiW-degrading membrane proteinase PrsW (M82 family)